MTLRTSEDCEWDVIVLACGGTVAMSRHPGRGLEIADASLAKKTIETLIESLSTGRRVKVVFLFEIDSTDMEPSHWTIISETIAAQYQTTKAFVVLTGTNTLAYLSSALSFSLNGINIPVVITGSQVPAMDSHSDASANIENSIRLAQLELRGVFVVFDKRIIVGCRAKKVSESQLDAFRTFNSADFGDVSTQIRLAGQTPFTRKIAPRPFSDKSNFCPDVICLTVLPGIKVERLIEDVVGVKGVILRSFGSGDIPRKLFPALKMANDLRIPVVNTTQCQGSTIMGLNEVGREALQFGVIQSFDMSMEAMSTKLMWLLGQSFNYDEVRNLMHFNLAGEISAKEPRCEV